MFIIWKFPGRTESSSASILSLSKYRESLSNILSRSLTLLPSAFFAFPAECTLWSVWGQVIIVAKASDGQRYPLPLCECLCVWGGYRGSGPEGADDLCCFYLSFKAGIRAWRLGYEPCSWDLSFWAGIRASSWYLSLKAGIWASRLGSQPWG